MKNLTKKVFAFVLTAGVVVSMAATSAFAENTTTVSTGTGIKNEFLEINTDDSRSDFTIYALGESGDKKKLLFNSTSNFTLKLNGKTKDFYCNDNSSVVEGDSIIDVDTSRTGINTTRTLSFIPNKVNGNKNIVEIKFEVTNVSDESKEVAGQIMLDTMLDDNDDAPFRIPNVGAVKTRKQFEGDNIPASYQAFDNLENPTIVSTGFFATGSLKPDYVQFNNYITSARKYAPECDTSLSLGDSVVNSIWYPVTLAPGESKDFVTYYGLGELEVTKGSLTLGATRSTSSFEANDEGNGYKPLSITTYLKNSSNVDVNNAKISFDLPQGVTLSGDSSANYDKLVQSEEMQNTWTLHAEPSYVEKTVTVKISANADDIDDVEPIEYSFTIPALERPTEPTTEPTTTTTTVPETTAAPTTIAATTAEPTTQAVTKAATPDQKAATADTAKTENGKVSTGDSRASFALLATVVCAAGLTLIVSRKRTEK